MIEKADIEKISLEIIKEYSQSPIRLIEDARTEINLIESEQGRFVLELLQNADDAQVSEKVSGSEYFGEPEIIFEVTDKYLYCANGGHPISKEGLESICRTFLSPKRKNMPVIGFKGIGFKSVLSITDQPEIFWHNGAVLFSRERTLEFLKLQAPNAIEALSAYKNDIQVPVLRCPHLLDFEKEVSDDAILSRLLETSATVFRFPLSNEEANQVTISKLDAINASMVLFMNKLSTLKVRIGGAEKSYRISKGAETNQEAKDRTIYSENNALVNDGGTITSWHIISGTYLLPHEIKEKLPPLWKDTESIKISFAISINAEGKYKPLTETQSLYVFFPTEERTPFQMLLHGTFRTNVDRRLLIQDDPLNDFAFTKTIELLRDKVFHVIYKNIEEPGQILDFVCPPTESSVSNVENAIWDRLVKALTNFPIIPNRANTRLLEPNVVLLAPLTTDIELLKSVFQGDFKERLCHDSIDSNENRRLIVEKLGAKQFDVLELPKMLEELFRPETNWVATTYSALEKVHTYLKAVDSSKDTEFIEEVKKRNILLLSDNTQASSESTTDTPIFFPPSGNNPLPPKGLKLRFLEGKAVSEYMRLTSKTIRGSVLYQDLSIDEYGAIPLIQKTIIPAVREFWKKWPNEKLFEPEMLLDFLQNLLQDSLPEDTKTIKAICLTPVPVIGDIKYAPAYSVNASKEWTNNDNLEFIYKDSSFLSPPSGPSEEDKQKKTKLYQWLGVSWLPRIKPQYEGFQENRSCSWRYGQCNSSPHSSLLSWKDYTKSVSEENSKLDEDPLSKDNVYLETSWSIDRFDEIITDPAKCLRLLSTIASNWDGYYSQYSECDIQWKKSREWYLKDAKIMSYFYWMLKNANWLPSSNFDIWSFKNPSEMFLQSKSIYDKLGDLVPYMQIEDKNTGIFPSEAWSKKQFGSDIARRLVANCF